MAVEAIGAVGQRAARTPRGTTPPAGDRCSLEAVAGVLSALLPAPVTPAQVRDKAIGLGLLRAPGSDEGTELTAQNASRLFLAGYHLPAQVGIATWPEMAKHVHDGRLAFLLLDWEAAQGPSGGSPLPWALQVPHLRHEAAGRATGGQEGYLLMTKSGAGPEKVCPWPVDGFADAWAAGGSLIVVALRHWGDLPAQGRVFFAGLRDRDGSYHWNTAECDTDREGNILRF